MKLRLLPLLISAITLYGCKSSRQTVMLDPVTVNASDSRYRATATMDWDITHTDVALSFDYAAKTAKGKAVIDMHPYFYNSDKIVLDAKSMSIESVTVNGNKGKVNYQDDSLTVYLDRKYHRTENVQLVIAYIAKPYAQPSGGSKAINDDKGLYFINTDYKIPYKPAQVWTQGETEANSHWVPTFDKPNERFTTRIQMTVADSFVTLSNGVMKSSVKNNDGTRTDVWEMDKNIQPYVMMMAIGKYAVVQDEPWQGKEISYYVEPEYERYAKDMFRHTPEMVDFFSKVTGVPYPWNKYSQVVVRDYVSGAMENTTATVFGEFINQTDREIRDKDYEDIVSHELFHQWFGDYVTAESWSNLTLNESFATYGEQLWRRYKYGKASEQKLAYQDLNTYLGQAEKNDEPLVRFHYHEREDMFDRISYQKGASILRYLHGIIGDTAFYKSMQVYLTENALQPAEAHQWRMAVEKVTGKDWNWFFNQWYYRGGHPVLEAKYDFDDKNRKVRISLTQQQPKIYRLPLKIDVVTGDNIFSDIIDADERTTVITYPYHNENRPAVIVDAEHWLAGVITDDKTPSHWLAHYKATGAEDYTSKVHAIKSNRANLDNATIQEMYQLALKDKLEHVRAFALNYLESQKNKKVQEIFTPTVRTMAMKDSSHHVRAAALHVLATWKIKDAQPEMHHGIYDYSYKVAAAALRGLSMVAKDTAYSTARHMLTTKPGGEMLPEIWAVIAEQGKAGDTTMIQDAQYRVAAGQKIELAIAAGIYMKKTESEEAFKAALRATEYLAQSEAIGSYRGAIAVYMYDAAYYYKDQLKKNNKAQTTRAERRLNIMRPVLEAIRDKETDKDNKTEYDLFHKAIYGGK